MIFINLIFTTFFFGFCEKKNFVKKTNAHLGWHRYTTGGNWSWFSRGWRIRFTNFNRRIIFYGCPAKERRERENATGKKTMRYFV